MLPSGLANVSLQRFIPLPLEFPDSMSELALRPRLLKLLLLSPLFDLPSRIALLRLMTGVSATGSAILVAE